jgi:hypothetical protein
MDPNFIPLSSLSMDLKRVALLTHQGATESAKRFIIEAQLRLSEVNRKTVQPYLSELLDHINDTLIVDDNDQLKEDALMYSVRIQNYCTKFLKK